MLQLTSYIHFSTERLDNVPAVIALSNLSRHFYQLLEIILLL